MKYQFKDVLKNIISLLLTQESRNPISTSIFKFKNKYKRIFRALYGTASDEEIFDSITKKLNEKCEVLIIHNSFNGMLPTYNGNLNKLLSLLISYCKQKDITLVMPTFFAGTNLEAKKYYENRNQLFDVRKTASEIGLLTELFRIQQGVKRSIHPTHSVCALGPLASIIVDNHHKAETTFGEGSPFSQVLKYQTMILGIGVKSEHSLTQIHTAEDILKDEYPIPLYTDILPVDCIDGAGNKLTYNLRIKNPEYILDRRSFFRILRKVKMLKWTYKGIQFYITKADVVTDTFIDAAKKGQVMYKQSSNN